MERQQQLDEIDGFLSRILGTIWTKRKTSEKSRLSEQIGLVLHVPDKRGPLELSELEKGTLECQLHKAKQIEAGREIVD